MFTSNTIKNAEGIVFDVQVDASTDTVRVIDSRTARFDGFTATSLLAHEGGLDLFDAEQFLTAENVEDVQRFIVHAFHLQVWDMPTLLRDHLPVVKWLDARYEVHFGVVSEVYIVDKRTGAVLPSTTTDVREALDDMLSGEAAWS